MSLSVSDLLNDDGTINVSKVRSIQNGRHDNVPNVSERECHQFRRAGAQLRDAQAPEIAAGYVYAKATIRRHMTGTCSHDTDAPPLRHTGDEWVIDQ